MFEDYLQDACYFYSQALILAKEKREREAKKYYRASTFYAASAMESYVNYIGDTFNQGESIDKVEIAFLNDKIFEVNFTKAIVEEKAKFNPLENKLKFIIYKFKVGNNLLKSQEWLYFLRFKDLRNSLVHPRGIDDSLSLSEYKNEIKNGINSIIYLINEISTSLFQKPLRKQMLELKL